MATVITRLAVDLLLKSGQFGDDLKKSERKARQFFNQVKRDAQTVKQAVGVTSLGVAAFGAVSAREALRVDEANTKMITQVGIGRQQVQAWQKDFLAIGNQAGRSLKEVSDGMFFVTSAGLRGTTAVDTLRASAKGAAIGLGEIATVADVSTSVLNAYGAANISAEQATGVLLATVKEGKASADSIAPALGRIIPVASELGVEFHEVGASIAAMTRTGATAEGAVTQVAAILNKVIKPSAQAKEALKGVGLSVDDLKQMLRDRGLFETLETLREKFKGNEEALTRVFEDAEAVRGVFALVGQSAEENRGIFERLAQSGVGTLNDAFAELQKSDSFKVEQATKQLSNTMTQFGAIVLPIVVKGAKILTGVVSELSAWMAGLTTEQKNTIATSVAVAAAIVPVSAVFSGLSTTVGIVARGVQFVTMVSGGAVRSMVGLGGTIVRLVLPALGAILSPIGLIIGAVAAAGAAIYYFRDDIAKALKPVGEFFYNTVWKPIDIVLSFAARKMSEFLAYLTKKVAAAADAVGLDDVAERLRAFGSSLDTFAKGSGPVIEATIIKGVEAGKRLVGEGIELTGQLLSDGLAKVEEFKDKAGEKLSGLMTVGDAIPETAVTGGAPVGEMPGTGCPCPAPGAQGGGAQDDRYAQEQNVANSIKGIWADVGSFYSQQQDERRKNSAKTWGALLSDAATHSKKLAKVQKAFAIGNIIIDTARGIAKVFAEKGWPAGIPGAAFIAAQGALQLATVKGQFHDGIDNVPDTGTYLLEAGERVVDKRLNADLSHYLASQAAITNSTRNTVTDNRKVVMQMPAAHAGQDDYVRRNRGALRQMLEEIWADEVLPSPFIA